ncbi:YitT family protein [Lysinibacillus yapensis]|uniref:YitT family protein n=2 Tax=Ureibacillus yapensis TaxID=2304605 RepID=A0A396SEW7_9BACL|nr:YitT family protein [Lysinibacillus yapensis]
MWKWLFFFSGLAVLCLGVSMTIKGKVLGVSPWDVLHIALFEKVGLTVGSWSVITGLIVLGSTSLYLKEWPKLATWLNMFLCGVFIDFFNWLLPSSTNSLSSALYFLLGVVILGVGCALYISPNLGAGPRDTLMIIFAKKFAGSIGKARLMMEAIIALIGWLLGGPVGAGTIIIALCTGYIVQWSLPFFRNMLEKRIQHSLDENKPSHKEMDHLAKES